MLSPADEHVISIGMVRSFSQESMPAPISPDAAVSPHGKPSVFAGLTELRNDAISGAEAAGGPGPMAEDMAAALTLSLKRGSLASSPRSPVPGTGHSYLGFDPLDAHAASSPLTGVAIVHINVVDAACGKSSGTVRLPQRPQGLAAWPMSRGAAAAMPGPVPAPTGLAKLGAEVQPCIATERDHGQAGGASEAYLGHTAALVAALQEQRRSSERRPLSVRGPPLQARAGLGAQRPLSAKGQSHRATLYPEGRAVESIGSRTPPWLRGSQQVHRGIPAPPITASEYPEYLGRPAQRIACSSAGTGEPALLRPWGPRPSHRASSISRPSTPRLARTPPTPAAPSPLPRHIVDGYAAHRLGGHTAAGQRAAGPHCLASGGRASPFGLGGCGGRPEATAKRWAKESVRHTSFRQSAPDDHDRSLGTRRQGPGLEPRSTPRAAPVNRVRSVDAARLPVSPGLISGARHHSIDTGRRHDPGEHPRQSPSRPAENLGRSFDATQPPVEPRLPPRLVHDDRDRSLDATRRAGCGDSRSPACGSQRASRSPRSHKGDIVGHPFFGSRLALAALAADLDASTSVSPQPRSRKAASQAARQQNELPCFTFGGAEEAELEIEILHLNAQIEAMHAAQARPPSPVVPRLPLRSAADGRGGSGAAASSGAGPRTRSATQPIHGGCLPREGAEVERWSPAAVARARLKGRFGSVTDCSGSLPPGGVRSARLSGDPRSGCSDNPFVAGVPVGTVGWSTAP